MPELLKAEDLCCHFRLQGPWGRGPLLKAVDGVSFTLAPGETLGLVGESGCGKSTLGRLVLGLLAPTAGRVWFTGADLTGMHRRGLKAMRRQFQIIFQDPYSSLNPRMTVRQILEEPFLIHGLGTRDGSAAPGCSDLLQEVGLAEGAPGALPPRILRRPAPAPGDRPGPGPPAAADGGRRAGQRPGRLHPGPNPQPAGASCRSATASPTSSSPTT